MSNEETGISLWPIIRANTVQVTATPLWSRSKSKTSKANGTIVYANNNHMLILTGGELIAFDYFNSDGTIKASVEVQFSDETEGRLFEGVAETRYGASILTDVMDAREGEVVLLHVESPLLKNEVARFRDSDLGIGDNLPIMMCANTYGYTRFSHVLGKVSSPYVPGRMIGSRPNSFIEYDIASGTDIRGAGIYDLSGCLIGIHSHEYMVYSSGSPGFSYAGRISRGIPVREILPIIIKLCQSRGVVVREGADAYEMLDLLSHTLYGTNITSSLC